MPTSNNQQQAAVSPELPIQQNAQLNLNTLQDTTELVNQLPNNKRIKICPRQEYEQDDDVKMVHVIERPQSD